MDLHETPIIQMIQKGFIWNNKSLYEIVRILSMLMNLFIEYINLKN